MKQLSTLLAMLTLSMVAAFSQNTPDQTESIKRIDSQIEKIQQNIDKVKSDLAILEQAKPPQELSALSERRHVLSNNKIQLLERGVVTKKDSAQFREINSELSALEKAVVDANDWNSKRNVLIGQLSELNESLFIYSQIHDVKNYTQASQQAIQNAKLQSKSIVMLARESFGGSVLAVNSDATTRTFISSFTEGMIILSGEDNTKAMSWIQKGMQAMAIAGIALAVSNYSDDENTSTNLAGLGGLGLLIIDQILLNKIGNKKTDKLKSTIDAMTRNIIFGESIRQDTAFVKTYKLHAKSLFEKVKFTSEGTPYKVDTTYWPSNEDLALADILIDDLAASTIFYNNIVSAATNLVDLQMTPDGHKRLTAIISDSKSTLSILTSMRNRLSSETTFIRQVNKTNANKF